ncbi:MAG: hypothetical protein HYU52_13360 [Acidobacteria bacterium]|nr:hypothetical protein [Acidobacteriota bacterium]
MNAFRLSCYAAAITFAAVTSTAAEPQSGSERRRAADPSNTETAYEPLPLGFGLRVFIDPETGQFRKPTRAELDAIAQTARTSKNKSSDGLLIEYRPDGSKHVDLQGRFMHALRVRVGEDGALRTVCSDHDHDHPKTADAPAAPADR